ncbi:MAG TPA: hypothetical protein VHM89_02540 [Acidimicrobiales bacterium]|nr:hypothetical protein [Acidimicrobiales bacterium]
MALWWIGNLVLLFVVVPVVLLLLNRLLRQIMEINAYANDILEHGVGITAALDSVPKLVTTRELAGTAHAAAGRYVGALQRIL